MYARLFQATQKGDLVAILKKQLEEREKQLAAEQEDATAAKNRQREITKVCHPSAVKSQCDRINGGRRYRTFQYTCVVASFLNLLQQTVNEAVQSTRTYIEISFFFFLL